MHAGIAGLCGLPRGCAHQCCCCCCCFLHCILISCLPGSEQHVTPTDLLALCEATSVMRAPTAAAVTESIRTSAAMCGYDSPSDLLPLLLQPPKPQPQQRTGIKRDASKAAAAAAAAAPNGGVGRRQTASALLQPAEKLRERAAALMQMQGLNARDLARRVRWSPAKVLSRDPKTQHLKLMLLQRQLLGWDPVHASTKEETLAPEMKRMLKKCPWVSWTAYTVLCVHAVAGQDCQLIPEIILPGVLCMGACCTGWESHCLYPVRHSD